MRGPSRPYGPGGAATCAVRFAVVTAAVACALCASYVSPRTAAAATPIRGGRTLLGFGQSYGGGSVHRGIDIAGASGTRVGAPVAGTVSFAGAVPADGGGTVIAVTLDVADGTKVTVMPLSRASAPRGATVQAGDSIGELAEAGDASSAETHVHLSLRRGSVYLDPAPLLGAAGGAAEAPGTQGASAASGSSSPAAETAVGGAAVAAASAEGLGPSAHGVTSAGDAGVSDASLASGVTLAPKATAPLAGASTRTAARTPAAPPQPGVVAVGASAAGAGAAVGGGVVSSTTVVHGVDVTALLSRARGSIGGYARRHVRALAIGVGALLAGVAALTPLDRRAGSGEVVGAVRPEGDAVAAAAGR